jgi:hypothetical protein
MRARSLPRLLGAAALVALVPACAGDPKPPRIEDEARQLAPPPACILRLPSRSPSALARNLREEQYWQLVFPSFDRDKRVLPEDALTCTGRAVFHDPQFRDAKRIDAFPGPVSEGEILLGSGGDRLRVLWMRTHRTADGLDVGPLALVRTKNDFAEVYGVGVYRGRTERPTFGLERMGYEAVVTVTDDQCIEKGRKARTACESTLSVFLPRRGALLHLVTFATDKRDYVFRGEPGSYGLIEYKLAAGTRFIDKGIVLSEEIVASDEAGRDLRHAEIDRTFKLAADEFVVDEPPLWPRVFPGKDAANPNSAASH